MSVRGRARRALHVLVMALALLAAGSVHAADAQAKLLRYEVLPELSTLLGGDSYLKTDLVGLGAEVSVANHLSVGVSYAYAFNELKPEGEAWLLASNANEAEGGVELDFPKHQVLLLAIWAPITGRLALSESFDPAASKGLDFDLYALVGAGRLFLNSGSTAISTVGAGVKLGSTSRLSWRLELRSEPYLLRRPEGSTRVESMIGSVKLGYRL